MSAILAFTSCKSEPVIKLDDLIVEEVEQEDNSVEQDSPEVKRAKHWGALLYYKSLTPQNKFNPNGTEKPPFDILTGGLEQHIKKIYIIRKQDFYHEKKWMAAHAHSYLGIICLPLNYTKELLFHEAAHVRHAYLDFLTDFSEEWNGVASITYGSLADVGEENILWKDGTEGPRHGCLTAYGSTTVMEDVAVFVGVLGYAETPAQIRAHLSYSTDINAFVTMYPFYFCDKTDQKYRRKLDLLRRHNFLNAEEHAKLSRNLGCLRDLWVENR